MSSVPLTSKTAGPNPALTLDGLLARARDIGTTPGFLPGMTPIMGSKAISDFLPEHWPYSQVRQLLTESAEVLTPESAERRTLVLCNPKPANDWPTSRTLVCAYQMILPGEVAPSHRHMSHALRLIIDGKGTYSLVNGVKMPMESGDVVLTPGDCWHSHGNEGDEAACWLDCLDVPLTYLLEPMYFQDHPAKVEPVAQFVTQSPYRFAWADTVRRLDEAPVDPDGALGARIRLPTPEMPDIQLSMERLQAGRQLRAKRSTANRIFCVVEGQGKSEIGEKVFTWSRGDTFVAPFWNRVRHLPESDTVLFEMSDQSLMEFVRYYREEIE